MEWIRKQIKMESSFYVDPIGKSWGLALWWNGDILKIKKYSPWWIYYKIGFGDNQPIMSSFIHAPTNDKRRFLLWEGLELAISEEGLAQMVIGDFNIIGNYGEKEGGNEDTNRKFEEYDKMLFQCNLIDVGFKGTRFT